MKKLLTITATASLLLASQSSVESSAAPRSQSLLDQGQASQMGLKYVITPERRALLNTIRFAEGTWTNGTDLGYRWTFVGGLLASLDQHPDRSFLRNGIHSTAAGAYLLTAQRWNFARKTLGITKFRPDQQDQAALFLIQQRKALPLTDIGVFSPQLAARLAPEWPKIQSSSYSRLNSFHKIEIAKLRRARDQRRQQSKEELLRRRIANNRRIEREARLKAEEQRRRRYKSFGDCSYDWMGWGLSPSGVRSTNADCGGITYEVAVDCKNLRIAKLRHNRTAWSSWSIPSGNDENVVVALCANILDATSKWP